MRSLLVSIFIILLSIHSFEQNSFRKNMIYGELAGNGIFLSVNYERQLGNKPGFGLHIGLGYASTDEKFRFTIPIGVDYLFILGNQKSFVETGLGVTWAEQYVWDNHSPSQTAPHPYKAGFIPSMGYRHQTHYGLMWKIDFTPVFTKYRNFPFLGISVGWRI